MKKIFVYIAAVVLVALCAVGAYFYHASSKVPLRYDYYIQNCDVFMAVDSERNLSVQEVVTVYLENPAVYKVIHKISKSRGSVTNIRVSAPHDITNMLGQYSVWIGIKNAEEVAKDTYQYKISYNYQLHSTEDNFEFPIINSVWPVPVQRARFRLQLPDFVKQNDVRLFIGDKQVNGSADGAEFIMKDERIIGQTTQGGLQPHQEFRIKVEVPHGFFAENGKSYSSFVWFGFLICTLTAFLLWYMYAQDDHIPTIVLPNPPRGINMAEAELIHNGEITERSLLAMIIALANKGYLSINTIGKNFTLHKLKDYTGKNIFVQKIMHALFFASDKAESSALKATGEFYRHWAGIQSLAGKSWVLKRFKQKSIAQYLRRIVMFGCLLIDLFLTLFVMRNYIFSGEYVLVAALVVFIGAIGINLFTRKYGLVAKIFGAIFLLYVLGLMFFTQSADIQKEDVLQIAVGICCTVIALICFMQMPQPNETGRVYKGQLFGLKNFIKFADTAGVEKMQKSNPAYFYKILPYAYVLNMQNDWLKLFEGVDIPLPIWSENENFKIKNFMRNFPAGISAALAASSICDEPEE